VKFLIDAQLPRHAVHWFANAGSDAIHTLDLPQGNRTADVRIINFAELDHRVVVTKDADFVDSHTLLGRPSKLLLVSTGNIANAELEALLVPLIPLVERELGANNFLELGRSGIVVRG
jgi:predicted nuclease of predicted toxin-antitoxin system